MHHFTIVKKSRYRLIFQIVFIVISFLLAYLLSYYHFNQQTSELTKQNKKMLQQLAHKQEKLTQLQNDQIALKQSAELFRKTNQQLESQYSHLNLSFNQLNNELLFYKSVLQTDANSKDIEVFMLKASPIDEHNLPLFIEQKNPEITSDSWFELNLTLINRSLSRQLLQVNVLLKLYLDDQEVDQALLIDESGEQKAFIKFQQFVRYKSFFAAKKFNRLEILFRERRKIFKPFSLSINQDNTGSFNYVSQ